MLEWLVTSVAAQKIGPDVQISGKTKIQSYGLCARTVQFYTFLSHNQSFRIWQVFFLLENHKNR